MVREHVFVEGLVQGVGFRYHTHKKAVELGLQGWVRNLTDGRVEILVEGPASPVKQFLEWVHGGPPGSNVEAVQKAVPLSGNDSSDETQLGEGLIKGVFSVR